MEGLFAAIKVAFWALLGLVAVVVVFGKRIEKKWDLEAKFRDPAGRKIGELEIELSRIAKEQSDYTLDVDFDLRHPALELGSMVHVYLEQILVLEGRVETAGRIRLGEAELCGEIKDPEEGQVVSVRCADVELMAAALQLD